MQPPVPTARTPLARARAPGFTLVEIMVVVTMIGILSAIAMSSFSRYFRQTRTVEAVGTISKICSGALTYYETDHTDSGGNVVARQFPGPTGGAGCVGASELPWDQSCCDYDNHKCPGSPAAFSDPIWTALSFNIPDPHSFLAYYATNRPGGTPCAAAVEAGASGDLDCDGTPSQFYRTISIVGSEPEMSPAVVSIGDPLE